VTQMYQSKIFSSDGTMLPIIIPEALGVEAGDCVRYIISDDSVQVSRTRCVSELAGKLSCEGEQPVSLADMQNAIVVGATDTVK